MKLLFDQNLSHRLPARLGDLFPDSAHVRAAGLEQADDRQIWEYAKANGYGIVSQDVDFAERSSWVVRRGKAKCMPTISMFYGIIVSLYFQDNRHHRPHIHAKYQSYEWRSRHLRLRTPAHIWGIQGIGGHPLLQTSASAPGNRRLAP